LILFGPAARRVIRREIRGARSARCNSEILSSLIIQPGNNMNNNSNGHSNNSGSGSNNSAAGKGYALVLPSSTLTAPIGSKNNGGLGSSCTPSERPRSALLPPVPPPSSTAATAVVAASPVPPPRSPIISANPHSPFYLYMADVPRNRHFESLESLQHAFTNMNSKSGNNNNRQINLPSWP
jgi:hypothetical protein